MLDALRADVLGVTVCVVAGLLTVGLCHYRSKVGNFLRIAESEHLLVACQSCSSGERASVNTLDLADGLSELAAFLQSGVLRIFAQASLWKPSVKALVRRGRYRSGHGFIGRIIQRALVDGWACLWRDEGVLDVVGSYRMGYL